VTDTYRHPVILQAPGPAVPDGDGGTTSSWVDLVPPNWHCSIDPATAKDLERVANGTVLSTNTYIVKGHYRAGVFTTGRLVFNGRLFSITGVSNPAERNITLELVAVEIVL
jgi:head-tail adaptor